MFAKIFESEKYGQLLAKADVNSEGCPEIRVYAEPPGLGVCSFAMLFADSEDGWNKQEACFEKFDLELAETMAAEIFKAIE